MQLPTIPQLSITPPSISNHSYTYYYQRKHLMLINGEDQFDSTTEQVDKKVGYKANDPLSQYQSKSQKDQQINITLLTLCPKCQKWLLKSQYPTHLTFHAAQITPQLFLGDKFSSQSHKQLIERLQITHIVNAASELPNYHEQKGLVYLNLELFDNLSQKIIDQCLQAAEFIKTAVQNQGKVFVHCAMGKSRSVAVILVYLIKYHSMTLKQSLQLVKQTRSIAKPNSSYMLQLQKFSTIHNLTQPFKP